MPLLCLTSAASSPCSRSHAGSVLHARQLTATVLSIRHCGGAQVLCAVGGDEEALQCRVGKTPDELKPDQGAAAGATAEAPGGSDSAAGASASAAEGQAADTVVALSPGNPAIQQGWLPGIGPSGVVNEWSHWEAKPQKLEAMLNNAVHILDMMMTLSSSHIGIKALDDKVWCPV